MVQQQYDGIRQTIEEFGEHMVLEVREDTFDSDNHGTETSQIGIESIIAVIQDITAQDSKDMTAGYLPRSEKVLYVDERYTLYADPYRSGSATRHMFIYYPGDGTTTILSNAKKYMITKVQSVHHPGDYSPDNSDDSNKAYTKAYLLNVEEVS